jgi:hypothetical protein
MASKVKRMKNREQHKRNKRIAENADHWDLSNAKREVQIADEEITQARYIAEQIFEEKFLL